MREDHTASTNLFTDSWVVGSATTSAGMMIVPAKRPGRRSHLSSSTAFKRSKTNEAYVKVESAENQERLWTLFDRVVSGDEPAWLELFAAACEEDEPMAKAMAAICYRSDQITVVPRSNEAVRIFARQSLSWLKRSSERGCKSARYLLGIFICKGITVLEGRGHEYGLALCEMAADQGFLRARYYLGRCYNAQGQDQDAERHFRIAAALGCSLSQHQLGLLNLQSNDYIEAAMWFEEASKGGHRPAKLKLAKLYIQGNGVAKDGANNLAISYAVHDTI
jgi:TPR repeat protein